VYPDILDLELALPLSGPCLVMRLDVCDIPAKARAECPSVSHLNKKHRPHWVYCFQSKAVACFNSNGSVTLQVENRTHVIDGVMEIHLAGQRILPSPEG